MKNIIFRLDDVSAIDSSRIYELNKILEYFLKEKIGLIFGVVPEISVNIRNEKENKVHKIEEAKGIVGLISDHVKNSKAVIALHGLTHQKNSYQINSEFCGLSLFEQEQKIMRGKKILENEFLREIKLFIPPWNTFDQNTVLALNKSGIKYLSAGAKINQEILLNEVKILPSVLSMVELIKIIEKFGVNSLCGFTENAENIIVTFHQYDFEREHNLYARFEVALGELLNSGYTFDIKFESVKYLINEKKLNFSKKILHKTSKNIKVINKIIIKVINFNTR